MIDVLSTILPGLHRISLPIPFEEQYVNVYLAEGTPLSLIDCGVQTDKSYQALADGLAAKGYRIRDIQRLLITHHHSDHLGLAQRIVEESGAELWAHPYTVPWLSTPEETRQHLTRFTGDLFREGGVPESLIVMMDQVSQYLMTLSGSAQVDGTLDEGDTLDLVGLRWTAYHTPGHAGGMICLYQPGTRVLLASDHLLRDVSSNPLIEAPARKGNARPKRLLDYVREMKRIAGLDIHVAYTGHGDAITNVPDLVDSRLAFHQQRADKLLDLFGGRPRTLYELDQQMFAHVPEPVQYLALSEVLGHLDLLEAAGRLSQQKHNGLVYWQPVNRDSIG